MFGLFRIRNRNPFGILRRDMIEDAVYVSGTNQVAETGDTYFPMIPRAEARKRLRMRTGLLTKPVSRKAPLKAHVNAARWIADCPYCKSAEFAWEDGLFYCDHCHNKEDNGKLRRVVMPGERKRIEDVLSARRISNRNWRIGETVDSLIAENLKFLHGLEV